MAKSKKKKTKKSPRKVASPAAEHNPIAPDDAQIIASNLSLHDLFQQQMNTALDRADLDDEQKQSILLAMNCPCCGGGFSFTAKLKRGT